MLSIHPPVSARPAQQMWADAQSYYLPNSCKIHHLWLHRRGPFFFKNPTKVTGERINSPIVDPLTPNQACRKILLLPHSRFDSTAMMTQYGGTTRVLIGTLIHLFSSFSLVNQSR